MVKIKLIVLVIALSLLSSCVVHNTYVPKHWRAKGSAAANIIVVVGFETRSPCAGNKAGFHSVFLYSETTHGSIQVDVGSGLKWDYADRTGQYAIARYAVRPGKYYVTNPFIFGSLQSVHAVEKVKLPFELEAGKTYYLGAFSVYVLSDGKNIFGQTVPWGFIWLADKMATPNYLAIKDKFPDVNVDNMTRLEDSMDMPPYIINDRNLLPKGCLTKKLMRNSHKRNA